MPSKVVYTDFRGGMIDERLRRRTDLSGYYNSASKLINAVPTATGGVKLRPGLADYSEALADAVRVIGFTLSVDESFAVVLWDKKVQVFSISASTGKLSSETEKFTTGFTKDEIPHIQYAQDAERLILVHENHTPFVISADRKNGGFVAGDLLLDAKKRKHLISTKEEDTTGDEYDYKGLFTTVGNYPSCVAFMSNRLWFMASKNHPYRLWASRPFEYNNFQTVDYVQRVDESVTTEQYLEAIEGNSFFRKDYFEMDENGNYKIDDNGNYILEKYVETSRVVDMSLGIVVETITTYDKNGQQLETENKTYQYTKPAYKMNDVIRADCAIVLDCASDRDERISWMGFSGSLLYVGTASSEWVIPADMSAVNYSITKISSYGSARGIQSVYGADSLFYVQSDSKKIRALTYSSSGLSNTEASYQCHSILEKGIKELVFQRVPDSRLYVVLKDGSVAVYTYEPIFGIQAWSLWESEYKIKSMCVLDSWEGQIPVALAEKDGVTKLMRFDEDAYSDGESYFTAKITTNNIEGDGTIPYVKKIFNIYVDSMNTEFVAMQDGLKAITPRSFASKLIKLDIYSKSTLEGTRLSIESIAGKPFELLAVAVEVEVSE